MIIVYGNFTATPKLLADKLRAAGVQVLRSRWGEGTAALRVEAGRSREELVLNWGVKIDPEDTTRIRATMLNKNAGRDKRAQCELLLAQGVRIPDTFGVSTIGRWAAPLVARKHIQSSGGQGVRIIPSADAVNAWQGDADHIYQELIEKRAEFRVHVWKDKAICVTRKYKDEAAAEHNPHIWNHGMGYVQRTVTKIGELMDETLEYVATKAVHAVGYDFGAVDIAMGMDGAMYVLEVNSAPSLIEERADAYVAAITNTLAGRAAPAPA